MRWPCPRSGQEIGYYYTIAQTQLTVKIWDATSGQETLTLNSHIDGIGRLAFSADGKLLAAKSSNKVQVWDTTSGQATFTPWATGRPPDINLAIVCVAFSSDVKRLATGNNDGTMKVWDATSGQELLTLTGHTGSVASMAFSPDGKRLVSASSDRTMKVWDVISGQELITLTTRHFNVMSASFSPDGKRLAIASDKSVKVWDAISGQETLTLTGHTHLVGHVAFSPDGKRRVSTGSDRTMKVWDARPWTPELRAEREALSLMHFLRDQGQPQSAWLAAIAADQTISEPVRQRALQFAREWK